ncbi:MAG TPA: FAD/NAD(P)-binding protein [Pilimelia sp.]|nr:FAD/NAD(P)-binding protein [Pilimelia sp.]
MTTFYPPPHLLDSPRGRGWPPGPEPRVRPASAGPPRAADVVIVGAGPAGLAVASALWHLGVRDVVLLDRADRPVGRFLDRVDVLRQRVLRSPYEHHPGVEGYRDCELLDFARLHWCRLTAVERREIRMAQAGHRSVVPVDVFEAFCRHVAHLHGVHDRRWRATVRAVRPTGDAVTVQTGASTVTARFVILCLGEDRRPAPAAWWGGGPAPAGVGYWDEPVPAGADRVVIGAGLTAAHLVSNALADGRRVHWVLRAAEERYQCADVNSAFFRAEGRARFDGTTWADRLALMRRQRRASVMFEFRPLLQRAEADGRLTVHRGQAVTGVSAGAPGPATVRLASGDRVTGDHVVLALGTAVAGGERLLGSHLVGTRDGWPDLDERTLAYRGAPRVFAVGAAAGMVLGPAARNIDGHRVATARVATTVAALLARGGPVDTGAVGGARDAVHA